MEPRAHPRNRDFVWASPDAAPRVLDDAQLRQWDEAGYFLLRDAFTADEIEAVTAEIDPIQERVSAFLGTRPGGKVFIAEQGNITFCPNLVQGSARLRRFCAHRVFRELGHDLIGPDVRLYWEQAVYKHPERPRRFPWHQDNGYTYMEPQQYLTCWVALTDAARDNGCPWVVPGLHRRGTLEHWMTAQGWQCLEEPEGAVAVEAPAGSVVVFSSLTPHQTGPNTSGAVRKSYIVQFAPDGAVAYRHGDVPEPQDDPDRQFSILVDGRPPAAAEKA
jgi:ectoine hydroxylase-related dioxygenase (phytanoyl-CoA dioxygenase family)